jgi:hypothetical protein
VDGPPAMGAWKIGYSMPMRSAIARGHLMPRP